MTPPPMPQRSPTRPSHLASRYGLAARSGSRGSRSAPSHSTSSTTASCSRTPGRPPATTSSAASSRSPSSLQRRVLRSPPRRGARDHRPPRRLPRHPRRHRGSALLPGGRPLGGRLHGTLVDRCRAHAPRCRHRHALDVAAARRPHLVAVFAASPACCWAPSSSRSPFSSRSRSPTSSPTRRAPTFPPAGSRYGVRGRAVHDERRIAAPGLVHPVAQRRRGDLVPRSGILAATREAARTARLRRPALRPSRRRRERGRPQSLRLAGRTRHPRRGRVPPGPPGRRSGADRRHRPLGRRRDDDRGGSRVAGV